LMPWMRIALPLMLVAAPSAAQSPYGILKRFDSPLSFASAPLVVGSTGSLYSTTENGGAFGGGTIFRINADGTGFTKLHDFDGAGGSTPSGPLLDVGGVLFGTTFAGGSSNDGVAFRMNEDGTDFVTIVDFNGSNGSSPFAKGLVQSGGVLYGAASGGGPANSGLVFKVNPDGSGFVDLHDFGPTDGADPSGLVDIGGVLYGTAYVGGVSGYGIVFRINEDGTGFQSLHDFDSAGGAYPVNAGLAEFGGVLYGVTYLGGALNNGTVFSINPDARGSGTSTISMAPAEASPLGHSSEAAACSTARPTLVDPPGTAPRSS
jgi:uncharacterized repeat protein (TIGR03803 family)